MIARVWQLAWPIIISGVSVPLLGVVDTAVMGHMPDPAYLGAVAVGALIFDFVYWGFGFLRMGTTGFTSRALGADDAPALQLALVHPLILAGLIGVGLYALQWPIGDLAFTLVDAGPEVEPLGRAYYAIRIWAAPAVLANYAILGWLIGRQRPRLALLTQLVTNLLNVGFDLLFVLGLGWGVEGVALGSVLAQIGGCVAGLIIVRRLFGPARFDRAAMLDRTALGRLWSVNRDIFLRTLGLMSAFAWFTAQGAAQGKVILAANAVLLNLQLIMAYALDGFASAAEVLVGEAMGRGRVEQLRRAIRTTMACSAAIALGFCGVWFIAGPIVIDSLTNLPDVRAAARIYLPWAAALPIVSVWCFQLDGICIGAMETRAMRNGMLLAVAAFIAGATLLMTPWGNHGLWAGFTLFLGARAFTLLPALARLWRGMWVDVAKTP